MTASTTAGLVAWLRDQIAATKQYAGNHPCDCWQTTGQCRGAMDCPARQRAQCEAHRRIVDRHTNDGGECVTCVRVDREWNIEGDPIDTVYQLAFPCPEVRDVALAYQHRPGYRKEWQA